jgi:hypothetical protein
MIRMRFILTSAAAVFASLQLQAAPIVGGGAVREPTLSAVEPVQYIYLGKPYCWYHYGWAGPGWYRCGYGTRTGLGWGGSYGWNAWELPRTYRALPAMPRYRYRHYD